jgi:hypothetical protein
MNKVQKHNSFNTNTPSSESYRNYLSKEVKFSVECCMEMQSGTVCGKQRCMDRHVKMMCPLT